MKKIIEVCMTYGTTVLVQANSDNEAIEIAKDLVDTGEMQEIEIRITDRFNPKDILNKENIINYIPPITFTKRDDPSLRSNITKRD